MRKSWAVGAVVVVIILVLGVSAAVFLHSGASDNFSPGVSSTAFPTSSLASPEVSPTSFEPQQYSYTIVNTYPHDPHAFTEGLTYDDGYLYESTGSFYEPSTLRRVDLTSGAVLASVTLSGQYFAEGIAVVNNEIFQLTYTSGVCFVYDKSSFALIRTFSYNFTLQIQGQYQGWGLTYDGTHLIMSDGTDNLYFVDPSTFQCVDTVQVHDGTTPISALNELEYINGSVYANIFGQRLITIINPETGQVTGWIDLSGLQGATGSDPEAVLNGIAYDAKDNRLFVTGKDWPYLYEIKLVPIAT